MKLNERKSGIVEFVGRKMKTKLVSESFQGLPICKEYKYLGLKLTNKLSIQSQLNYIKKKSFGIHQKLSPFLHNADLDTRKSLWQIFIQPLIEFVLPLYYYESAKCHIAEANAIIRGSFKLFAGLKRNTANNIVDLLSGYNFPKRAYLVHEVSLYKWSVRKLGEKFEFGMLPQHIKDAFRHKTRNICSRMPRELIHYLNTLTSLCQTCKVPNTIHHLSNCHNKKFPDLLELLKLLDSTQTPKQIREKGLEKARNIIKPLLEKLRHCIEEQNWIISS